MQRKLLSGSNEPLTKLTKWNLNYGEGAKHYDVASNRELNVTRDQLRDQYNDFMVQNKVDFILSPTITMLLLTVKRFTIGPTLLCGTF